MRVSLLVTLFACLFHTAHTQEWVRQHPFAGFAPLHDITFDEQGNGWAVGQQSLILHSSDWGNSWKIQRGLPIGYSFQTVEIVPGTNAQTVLVGGPSVFVTTDGGQNWTFANLPQQIDAVNTIQAFDAQRWVVIGLLKGARTDDAGQTWTIFEMPHTSTNSGWFTDLNTGWVGSGPFNEQQVFKTTDGGMTWDLADDDLYPVITDLMMLNDQVGFLSARDYIFKTTNGGSDWVQMHDNLQPSLTGLHVVSEQIIWCGQNNGTMFRTLDGGNNWNQIQPQVISGNSIDGIYATADGRVWAPGKFASISYTMDGGQTWYDQTPGRKNTLHDIQFDGETGFAVGYGLILRTNDNGIIWDDIRNDEEEYRSLAIVEDMGQRHLFAGAGSGMVLHSTNDGDDWSVVGENLNRIETIYAHNAQEILVGASTGISRTTNGGQTWEMVANTSRHVAEIQFADAMTGLATVDDGQVLKTTDGGQTWSPVLERTNYRFSGVHLESSQLAWTVAEFIDTIFKTADGGATWTSHNLPYNTFWQDIAFMDADTGYLAGGSSGSGIILHTTDGGETWTYDVDERAAFEKLWIRDGEEYVWAVGFGGNILHFSPCAVAAEISNLRGEGEPCEGSVSVYEVDSEGATIFTWNIPDGWAIQGSDNSSRIEVLVGSIGGVVSIQAANSCGFMTETLSQNVLPLQTDPVSISESAGVLSTTVNGASYLWYQDGSPIPGATDQSYTPEETGSYFVVVTYPNGCTRASNSLNIVITGVFDMRSNLISVFPNPVSDILNIQTPIGQEILSIAVFNSSGGLIFQKNNLMESLSQVNTTGLTGGVYCIRAMTSMGSAMTKFVVVQ